MKYSANLQRFAFAAALAALASPSFLSAQTSAVKVWEKETVIPTYLAGDPEPNPMFFFGRQSQGAQGKVYPYPLYDTLTNRKVDKTYKIVYLENEYVRIGILPEIGGRIFEGVDKTNDYNFIYRQHVIKPALIGLIGAWISGGVEWNIPHHHRASTFLPVQYLIEDGADGGKTVWVGELEVRHRLRWAVGYTLRPGKAYLEASVRIVNRTPVVNTMLCFANLAVHANENYQVIYPPSTQYGTYHGKREFTAWPIGMGRYAGADFTGGVDVSWYKNHVSSNSIFAWNYEDDFFAGYDHGKQAGTMSVTDHNIVPGKKFWTWGSGPRGRMWDHILTDDDGPYIELMVGAYSDNQPDYSWLQPFEVKSFAMNWYPFRDIGGVKKANLEAAVNLDVDKNGSAKVGFYTTSAYPAATVLLKAGDKVLLQENVAISPGKPYVKQVPLAPGVDEHDLRASISAGGKELVSYSPIRLKPEPMPKSVAPPPPPQEIKTNEELYLTGLRIEQFHDPNLDPEPYWEEALRRDPGDARVNTALGITWFKKARFADAERLFRKALERLTDKYTAPKDAEAIYYLGLTLKARGKTDEAFTNFYKATWSLAWRAAGYYSLAEIASARGDLAAALDFADRSLDANALNIRALNLKAAVLRRLGRAKEALQVLAAAHRKSDPLDARSMAERWLAAKTPENARALAATLNAHPATAAETAAEYVNAGLWQDGTDVLLEAVAAAPDKSKIQPMVYYYLGYMAEKMGQKPKASEYCRLAAKMPPDYVFPFQYEAIDVLRYAMQANPSDARAPYYLGNLLFDWQPGEAVALWETSASLDPSFPIVHRNLGIAYSRQKTGNSLDKAVASLEKAVALPRKYALQFAELDELYEAAGVAPEKRLALLENNHDAVSRRDDALAREIALKVTLGKYDDAIRYLTGRPFAVWEGGTLTVVESWMDAHLLRGRQRFAARQYREALADFQAATAIPDNLPTERISGGARAAEVAYWIGNAYEALGDPARAKESWQKSAAASSGPPPAMARRRAGNMISPQMVQLYYQALSLGKLGETGKAQPMFQNLVDAAGQALSNPLQAAPGAPYTELQSQRARLASAHYVAGLGYLGLNDRQKARQELMEALQASPDHLGARTALRGIDAGQ
jgi:tetratricopeptide (TPR) repeat protein